MPVDFEVLSVKTSYRSDYRHMLSDITSYYTDLVMQQGSPVTQKFEVDYDTPSAYPLSEVCFCEEYC